MRGGRTPDPPHEDPFTRWFAVVELRIQRSARSRGRVTLTLVEAMEARDELDKCIDELCAKLDVVRPPSRLPSDD